ncbi:MAG TPA: hypothetical protein DCQ30_05275 [Acidimicrobiaceae bacterium]|nr:hypothetical protein [Acidimicrobiaceae bacterium]
MALAGCQVTIGGPAEQPPSSAPAGPATQSGTSPGSQAGLVVISDPGQVTGTIHGTCHYRDGGELPDPHCTPGSIDPAVTQANIHQTICISGYTRKVRPPASETDRFKYDVAYPAYGTPQTEKTELDHLVSLELGGSNDAANLWPEDPPSPNSKDEVEDALHRAVCDGRVTLAAAQRAIAGDWLTAESVLGLKGLPWTFTLPIR